jgi:hypothetical protein
MAECQAGQRHLGRPHLLVSGRERQGMGTWSDHEARITGEALNMQGEGRAAPYRPADSAPLFMSHHHRQRHVTYRFRGIDHRRGSLAVAQEHTGLALAPGYKSQR